MIDQFKLTPLEAVEKYPQLLKIGWDENFLGRLLSKGLLTGTYDRKSKVSIIDEGSLIRLAKYHNELKEQQKVQIK